MKIMIDISEEQYKAVLRRAGWVGNDLYNIIKNGTSLPKGHGDLIDKNDAMKAVDLRIKKLSKDPVFLKKYGYVDILGVKDYIREISAIVEADKKVE